MTFSILRSHGGIPALFLDDRLMAPIIAYVGPHHLRSFKDAGIQLYTFYTPGIWWIGPNQYDFSEIDSFLETYCAEIPNRYFMPRIDFSQLGYPWWGQMHPNEMNILRNIQSGDILSQIGPNPQAIPYLGHDIQLDKYNLHSFHSKIWRKEAKLAISALVSHCESRPYADQIWGWHICDGLFCEWFHWNEYSFDGMADYSQAALLDFRLWLQQTYKNDPKRLSRAWGKPVTFETVEIPLPKERNTPSHGEFYDPINDRPTIDYTQCMSDATVDCIVTLCQAVKQALPQSKVTCVFYGYQFSNMPRAQLNAHYALQRLLSSPAVDMIASPHSYSYRGEGGYHSPQAIADSIRRAGKLHIDEIDCKTVWTPASVTWKTHISQPKTIPATIEMMKKDAAYQLASGTAQWWMDLTDQGWFDAPDVVEPIRKLKAIEERLETLERNSFAEIAFVVSQRSMMFQAPREGLHNATMKFFRNWHLSRMGAPFEQIMIDDLERPDISAYKLYIMANTFYVTSEQCNLLETVFKRNNATALWIYAPGYLDETSANLENMHTLTGISFGQENMPGELNVNITNYDHPITKDLPMSYAYGTGILREQYLQPPKTQYLPYTASINPHFYANDPKAVVLGLTHYIKKPGLVVKDNGDWRSIYSSAPLLPWQLMRNIARFANVHIYNDQGDMVWANNHFLAIYSQSDGKHIVYFPRKCNVEDAYDKRLLSQNYTSIELEMKKWETKLLFLD